MIEKWFCLKCDNCDEAINYWERDNVREAIKADPVEEDNEIKN